MYEELVWDSAFFAKRVFRWSTLGNVRPEELVFLKGSDSDLIYCVISNPSDKDLLALKSIGAVLYDKKVTYAKTTFNCKELGEVKFISTTVLTEGLEKMAYQSGVFSRFRLDPLLQPKFESLYYQWIIKSLNREIADEVFIAADFDNVELGFVTLKERDGVGRIGLIAVDDRFRGRGIGTQLLLKADHWAKLKSLSEIEVVTQLDNGPACKLYEKLGYTIKKIEYIFHYWNNNYQ